MPPQVATVVFALGIVGLFALSRDGNTRTSKALWIPVVWLLIGASRNVSQWLQMGPPVDQSVTYLEGNPVDRTVLTGLLVLGLVVLVARRHRVGALMRANPAILVYFLYCGASVLWSDYPDVAFRRWFRALGDIIMVLVVLSDSDWSAALKRVFLWAGFVLVPVSILFIKYYPDLGRAYNRWTWRMSWTGVATDKNGLGLICLVFGLASTWHFLQALRGSAGTRRAGPLIAHGALVAMVFWLLLQANSATAFACFFLAGGIMVLTSRPSLACKSAFVHLLVAAVLSVVLSATFLGDVPGLIESLGRESTLTGRTGIWRQAISMSENPLLGAGFESFWLGEHIDKKKMSIIGRPNQAHNGYLEIYLNMGWLGVALLTVLIVPGYRRIVAAVHRQADASSLRLAYFVAAALYNLTEAGFKMMHPLWIALLLAIIVVPRPPVPTVPHQRTDDSPHHFADPLPNQSTYPR